jgi:hypothetical protein
VHHFSALLEPQQAGELAGRQQQHVGDLADGEGDANRYGAGGASVGGVGGLKGSSNLLERLFVEPMDQNEEIFVRFVNDASFRKVVTTWMAEEAYRRLRSDQASDDAGGLRAKPLPRQPGI